MSKGMTAVAALCVRHEASGAQVDMIACTQAASSLIPGMCSSSGQASNLYVMLLLCRVFARTHSSYCCTIVTS